jgi:hypothetical protein
MHLDDFHFFHCYLYPLCFVQHRICIIMDLPNILAINIYSVGHDFKDQSAASGMLFKIALTYCPNRFIFYSVQAGTRLRE